MPIWFHAGLLTLGVVVLAVLVVLVAGFLVGLVQGCVRDREFVRNVEFLRRQEGDSIEIVCDNPEAQVSSDQCVVRCSGEWTRYEVFSWRAGTIGEAAAIAAQARRGVEFRKGIRK